MAFQREVGSGVNRATDVRDLLTKIVAFATSQHVATVAINNGGTGGTYVVGDVVTLTHGSAFLDARFEVLTVSAGQILTMRIRDSGAFALRLASAVANAGGSGYVVGDILQVQGGSAREEGKFSVATLSGSAVATVTLFESGGAYSSAPGLTGAATLGIGPSTFAGDDACTLDLTMQALISPLTNVAVTGGGGTGATVDITLAETGHDATERNTNDRLINGFDLHKQVTLKGDAAGKTNKPFVHYRTRTDESGVLDRFSIQINGSISHNPALDIDSQVGLGNQVFLLGDEDEAQEMDFWLTVDDQCVAGVTNINPAAAVTDDGEYMHFYAGFIDTFATETEDPYPLFTAGCSRIPNVDPSASNAEITGLSELVTVTSGTAPAWFYRSEDSTWVNVENGEGLIASQFRTHMMFPMCRVPLISGTTDADLTTAEGPVTMHTGIGSTGRAAPTRRLVPVPGSTGLFFPIPLTIISRPGGGTVDQTLDTVRGQLRGFFWISATDAAGATITNFSEDFITIGTDRYRVFHTQVNKQLYHYICVKEDV